MYYARRLKKAGFIPPGASGTLMTQLFNRGKAMFVISGQWFRGEIAKNINYGVAQLPVIDDQPAAQGRRAVPFLTVEGYFMARYCRDQKAAFEVIKFFTSVGMARYFGVIGKQTPANQDAYARYPILRNEPVSRVFRMAAGFAVPMPNNPEMTLTWGPATSALNQCLGDANGEATLNKWQNALLADIAKNRGK
jgi:arabinogalactan oligomer/maltooligosaccharide transport system substrate-binding protein